MTSPASNSGIVKQVVLASVTLGVIAIAALGCYLLLPVYSRIEAQFLLGEATSAYLGGQDSKAIAQLNQAIVLDPTNVQAYNYRGLAHSRKDDNDKAIADFNKALQLAPQDEEILFNCGYAYETKGDFKGALNVYNRAVTLHPQSSMAYNDYAWLLATCPHSDLRDGKRAVQLAVKACDLSGWKNAASLDTLAAAYAEVGDFDSAVKFENVAMGSIGFSDNDAAGAKVRLALYQAHQPYHRENE